MAKKKRKATTKKKLRFLKKMFDVGMFLLIVLIITFLLHEYVIERLEVHNYSMEPTLSSGDVLITDKLSYLKRDPKRYEIIIFKNKSDGEELIKRVIGLPGESVRIIQGKIYINGKNIKDIDGLDLPAEPGLATNDFVLAEDEYFVLGDNRKESIDSRYEEVGAVKRDLIISKTLFRIKPISKFRVK